MFISIVYAWVARCLGVAGSMACALLAWAFAVAGLQAMTMPLAAGFALVWGALLVAPRLFPALESDHPVTDKFERRSRAGGNPISSAQPLPLPLPAFRWALAWGSRLRGNALVLSVTFAAAHIGARLSGFLAMFPVMSTVLVGFSHVYAGRAFAIALLRGMVAGYFAFSAASACALAVQIGARRMIAGRRATEPVIMTTRCGTDGRPGSA